MKKGIARIVTRRITPLMILAYIILLIFAFVSVSHIVREDAIRNAQNISGIYADIVNYNAWNDEVSVDENYAEKANIFGDYFCKWNGIDYAYMYIPNTENDTIKYVAFSQNNDVDVDIARYIVFGKDVHHKLTEGEEAIWNGDSTFSISLLDEANVTVMMTQYCIKDRYDNKVISGVGISYTAILREIIKMFLITAACLLIVFAGIYIVIYRLIKRKISDPTRIISNSMIEYASDVAHSNIKLNEDSCLEYSMISSAFNSMSNDISEYLDNIQQLTNEKLKQQTELDVAARIQQGILPKEDISSDEFHIQCLMRPARNVGGDLYDYIQLDENRTMLVIADVSGKGITAAIFMAITLILIREYSKADMSPAEILTKANNTLCEKNPAMLFATAFVGVYDKRDQSFTYSNAGHNPPYLIGRELHELENVDGSPIGLFADENYSEKSITLNPGETLFMYTDGVNEIINESKEFFGTERLEQLLKEYIGKDVSYLPSEVFHAVKEFAGTADQFDDITMLSLTCRASTSLELNYSIEEFGKIRELILALPIDRDEQLELCLAAEEIFVNIISYAFPEGAPENEKIKFTLSKADALILRFEDGGVQFNPTKIMPKELDYDPDEQIGGLGGFITANIIDNCKYEYIDNKNVLEIVKNYEEDR